MHTFRYPKHKVDVHILQVFIYIGSLCMNYMKVINLSVSKALLVKTRLCIILKLYDYSVL